MEAASDRRRADDCSGCDNHLGVAARAVRREDWRSYRGQLWLRRNLYHHVETLTVADSLGLHAVCFRSDLFYRARPAQTEMDLGHARLCRRRRSVAAGLIRPAHLPAILQLLQQDLRLARRGYHSDVVVVSDGRGDPHWRGSQLGD